MFDIFDTVSKLTLAYQEQLIASFSTNHQQIQYHLKYLAIVCELRTTVFDHNLFEQIATNKMS